MNDLISNGASDQTMSSREIAALTGKQHKDVMADIRNMCDQLEIQSAEFSADYIDSRGRAQPCFQLDRYHTEVLVTGYDVKRRAAVIKRWFDLETGQSTPIAYQPKSEASSIILGGLEVAQALGVPTHYAQIESIKEARRVTGVDYSPLLAHAPAQDDIPDSEVMLEPTEMAPHFGLSSGMAMNRELAKAGLQVKDHGKWVPTTAGEAMSYTHSWERNGKSGYNIKWNLEGVRSLLDD